MSLPRWPRTLDELRQMSRSYGEAAASEVRWCAITGWLLVGPEEGALSNPSSEAWEASRLTREHQHYHLGWPRHDGREHERLTPALDGLDPVYRQEVERVALETLADWKRAGCPGMTPQRLKSAYQFLISSPAFRAGSTPALPVKVEVAG